MAICLEDTVDSDGWQLAYEVIYVILSTYNPDIMEDDMACNWDEPENVILCGKYNLAENRFA